MTAKQYNQCVDLYADRVLRFIAKNIRNKAEAKDVVQNAFEILWKNHAKIDFAKAKAYLFSVSHHNMIDGIRKMRRIEHSESLPETAISSVAQEQTDLKVLLEQALAQLPENQRSIVLLRDYEGYAYKEIATILKMSETQVKVYLFRARKKLKQYLGSIQHII
ncbi:MAG: RNA polymerase sigma factor [Chitinophagales bacterium]